MAITKQKRTTYTNKENGKQVVRVSQTIDKGNKKHSVSTKGSLHYGVQSHAPKPHWSNPNPEPVSQFSRPLRLKNKFSHGAKAGIGNPLTNHAIKVRNLTTLNMLEAKKHVIAHPEILDNPAAFVKLGRAALKTAKASVNILENNIGGTNTVRANGKKYTHQFRPHESGIGYIGEWAEHPDTKERSFHENGKVIEKQHYPTGDVAANFRHSFGKVKAGK